MLALFAILDAAWVAVVVLGAVGGFFLFRVVGQCGTAMTELVKKLQRPDSEELVVGQLVVLQAGEGPSREDEQSLLRRAGGAT
jgi:hypothetical protein